ncbi:pilin [Entomomonas sp. E2T0]|uniref:pilin n=1 Tax=Entomomonas sp. E2T0 TaxID=2930213 RepID=UPI0022282336|nr:pilin [Entomomonas sp. E2T0]UYZ85176.1 pilin [Entomomonas sp. E2T0]
MKKYLVAISLLIMPVIVQADDIEVFQKPKVSLAGFVFGNVVNMAFGSTDYRANAQMSEALSLASGQKAAVAEYFVTEGRCPDNTGSNTGGIAKPSVLSGKYVEQVVVKEESNHCTITATMKTKDVNPELAGKTLTLIMTPLDTVLMWECYSEVNSKYLPASCQQ